MPFRPKVDSVIEVNNVPLRFTEHPAAKGMPYGQTGRKATVYQVLDNQGYHHALKVFKSTFRLPQNEKGAVYLRQYAGMPGLHVCNRVVLVPEVHVQLLAKFPDLTYAVLMPWVEGETWHDVFAGERKFTPKQSSELATYFSSVLVQMENAGLAHCDLSAPNVIITPTESGLVISLVDVEDMYGKDFERPTPPPAGTSGYGHKTATSGIWHAAGDRFAGAVLLAEMLGWCDARVRRIKYDETFFDSDELQKSSERYQVLLHVLRERWGERVCRLFSQAWYSETLEDCPTFKEWNQAILAGPGPSPLELRKEIDALITSGGWNLVAQKCEDLLNVEGQQLDVLKLKSRALKILELKQEIEVIRVKATFSGSTSNWQALLTAYKSLEHQDCNRPIYLEQIALAQVELETAMMLDQVDQCLTDGHWRDAHVLLEKIHTQSPRLAPLQARIDVRLKQDIEMQELLASARKFLSEGDWDQAVSVCQKGLALGVEQSEFQKLLEKALVCQESSRKFEQGISQVNSLFEQREWQQALTIAEKLALEYPKEEIALDLKDSAREKVQFAKKTARARSLLAKQEYHPALAILKDIPRNFPEVEDMHSEAIEGLSLKDRLEEARAAYDPTRVLNLLKKAPAGSVDTGVLRNWAKTELIMNDAVESAKASYDLLQLSDLLKQIPSDHPRYRSTASWIAEQQVLREKIVAARASYDGSEMKRLLIDVPYEYPQREELLAWAEHECDRKARLAQSRKLYQWKILLELAAELPNDYPDRDSIMKWADELRVAHQRVEDAREMYDLHALEANCEMLASDDPLQGEIRTWLEHERNRVKQVEAARLAGDYGKLLELLWDAPADYPDLTELLNSAKQEEAYREALQRVYQTVDLDEAEDLLNQLPKDSDNRAALFDWLEKEKERAEKIRKAQLSYQYNEVLRLISDIDYNCPRFDEVRSWAKGWLHAEETIERAFETEDYNVLEAYIEQLPLDHPRNKQIRKLKEDVLKRYDDLRQMEITAEQALNEARYETVINICRQALLMKEANESFKAMLASAEHGLTKTRQTRHSLQEVRDLLQEGQFEQALALCRASLEQDTHNDEARSIFLRIREALELQAKKLDQAQKWKASARTWKLLVEMGKLPDGVQPIQHPDLFNKNAVAGEKRAHAMWQKEIHRFVMIGLAVMLALIIVVGLVYLAVIVVPAASFIEDTQLLAWLGDRGTLQKMG